MAVISAPTMMRSIVDQVRADSVHVGDIVTFNDPENRGDSITHRVRRIEVDGAVVHFETRGDANTESEHWSANGSDMIGRYSWRVPVIGRALVALASPTARLTIGATALLLLAWSMSRRRLQLSIERRRKAVEM